LELVLAWILGGDFGWIWDPFLPLFLGSIFMVLFRSAIAPEIACFIGFCVISGSF
jgi:hypothetical protein